MGSRMPRWTVRRPPEWGVEPVPDRLRVLRAFDVFVLWSSLGVGLLVFVAGSNLLLFFGLNLWETLAVSVAGSILGSVLLAASGVLGSVHGVPTMVSLRAVLGRRGSYVPTVLNALQLFGWAAFELLVMGLAATVITGPFLGPTTPYLWIVAFGLVCGVFAVGGPLVVVRQWIAKFAIWMVFLSTALVAYRLLASGLDMGARLAPGAYLGTTSLLLGLDLVIAMPISWWPLIADYNRFTRSVRSGTAGTVVGYALANTLFFFLGAALLVGTGQPDVFTGIAALGLGVLPLLLILVDETDNGFANLYSTAVSIQNVRPRWRQLTLVLGATAVALAGAVVLQWDGQSLGGAYNTFLFAIGGVFVPLLGVLVADFFVVRRRRYARKEFGEAGRARNLAAFVAWVPGTLLYLWIFWSSLAAPPGVSPVGATLPAFGLSVAVYWVASAITARRDATRPARG